VRINVCACIIRCSAVLRTTTVDNDSLGCDHLLLDISGCRLHRTMK